MTKLPKNYQSGQTILVILLIMAVVLTIGLSAISSSITDIKISQETEEASRAYYVAESAIEEQMLASSGPGTVTDYLGGVKYEVTIKEKIGTEFLFPNKIEAGDAQTVWLVGHDETTGNIDPNVYYEGKYLDVCWGKEGAVLIDLVYSLAGGFQISRQDCDSTTRNPPNNFVSFLPGAIIEGESLNYCCKISTDISGAKAYLAKLTLLYNVSSQSLGVKTDGASLPKQGSCFESKATITESGVTRKIKQCKLWPDFPNIFAWGIFSGEGDLKKSL